METDEDLESGYGAGTPPGDNLCNDYAQGLASGFRDLAEPIFSVVPRERVDFAELYDDYPVAILMQLEDLGFCEKGKGTEFIRAHDFTVRGDFPLNTGGGQLSRGQPGLAGGHLHVVEALRQLKGEAGKNQVAKRETALVTGIGLLGYNVNIMCCAAMMSPPTR